jgi:transposase
MTRTAPHDWLRAFNALGPEGLNRMRGPKIAAAPVAELERVIGRQQLEREFFRQALRALEGMPAQASSHLCEVIKEMTATHPP